MAALVLRFSPVKLLPLEAIIAFAVPNVGGTLGKTIEEPSLAKTTLCVDRVTLTFVAGDTIGPDAITADPLLALIFASTEAIIDPHSMFVSELPSDEKIEPC